MCIVFYSGDEWFFCELIGCWSGWSERRFSLKQKLTCMEGPCITYSHWASSCGSNLYDYLKIINTLSFLKRYFTTLAKCTKSISILKLSI